MKKDEKSFSKHFVNCFSKTWIERIEPSRGMQTGIPDIYCMISGQSMFVELKVGTVTNGLLFPNEIRPSQFSWHKRYKQAGGVSFVCVGVMIDGAWHGYFLDIDKCSDWKRGIDLKSCFLICHVNNTTYIELDSALNRRRHGLEAF